jgi:hypothetical protein
MSKFNEEFYPLKAPEHCPGSYDLHLYCKYDNPDHGFDEFPWVLADEETRPAAHRSAREAGWIIHRDRTATCPKCAARLARGEKPK